MQVKVCGITTPGDADGCVGFGVNLLGLNFVPGSPRQLDREAARAVASAVRGRVRLVGVFRDASLAEITEIARFVGLDAVQLHGFEDPAFCAMVPFPVWKAFPVGPGWDPAFPARFRGLEVRLFDTAHSGQSGGTGRAFDWSLLANPPQHPWFLAGGLQPGNLSQAMATLNPDGLDLNSGVEIAPGVKDMDRLERALTELLPWRGRSSRANRQTLPGRPLPDETHDGVVWTVWEADSSTDTAEEERHAAETMIERHGALLLDLRQRGNCTPMIREFMNWQMHARARGRRLRFRFDEKTIVSLVQVSMINLLDIVE